MTVEKNAVFVYNKRILETNTPTITDSPSVLRWEAPARKDHVRSPRWYFSASVITLMAVAYSLIERAWTMTITVLLAAALYFLIRNQDYKKFAMELSENGITIDGEFAGWKQWRSFWILQGPNHAELHVMPATGRKDFVVLLDGVDPYLVRDILGRYLEQDMEKRERIFDTLSRICKL